MKEVIFMMLSLFIVESSTNIYHIDETTGFMDHNDITYLKSTMVPVNGIVYSNSEDSLTWTFVDGQLNGLSKRWDNNGNLHQEKYFKNGLYDSLFKEFYNDGKLHAKGNYKNDEKNGVWKFYYASGKLSAISNWENDNMHGEFIQFDEDSNITYKTEFKHGDGFYKYYWQNGQLQKEGNIKSNYLDGVWRYWHKNGQLKHEGNYIDRNRNGLWKFYYKNGQLQKEIIYKEIDIISEECWDKNGNKIQCENLKL